MEATMTGAGATWAWWEARRLRYNLGLGLAGWIAYGLALALGIVFGQPLWSSWQLGFSITILLGAGFLVLIVCANICYLAGAAMEALVCPSDPLAFRTSAYWLGFWGSAAVPFLFPLVVLASLLATRLP